MPEKFYIEQAEQIFPVERYNNLREFIETASPDVMRTAYFHVPTELSQVEKIIKRLMPNMRKK